MLTAPIESAAAFGQVMCDLSEVTDVLLGQLYDDLAASAMTNGTIPKDSGVKPGPMRKP